MKILISILVTILLIACADINPIEDEEIESFAVQAQEKAELYLSKSFSMLRDEYGLLLPNNGYGTFIDQGDALIWNSIALASLCLIGDQEKIDDLWVSYITNLQMPDGSLIRHPTLKSGVGVSSISRDGITGFLFLGSIAWITKCSIFPEYGERLQRFADYGANKNWLVGAHPGDITPITDRHLIKMVLSLYNRDTSNLSLKTSIHNLSFQVSIANEVNKYTHECKKGIQRSCDLVKHFSPFVSHLAFLSVVIARIDAMNNPNPTDSLPDTESWLLTLSAVGDDIGFNNWLFVAGYRKFVRDDATYRDIHKFIAEDFPHTLPTESNGVSGWGCTDYIWQRSPGEYCSDSKTIHIGQDLLLLYGLTL